MKRYLTKSRFKLATECPSKLFYTRKKEYADNSMEDDFLKALAEGGFQVGELAKCYYPKGVDIRTLDAEQALAETNQLLEQEEAVIFEAAIRYENLFIRVDILEKKGNQLLLKEVKAKSFSSDDKFTNRDGSVSASWKSYLYDVAFQKYVLQKAFPQYQVASYLVLINKNTVSTVDQLHQKFLVIREGSRSKVIINDRIPLGGSILAEVDTDAYVDQIMNGHEVLNGKDYSFEEYIQLLSDAYAVDKLLQGGLSRNCRYCQFKASPEQEMGGLKSGYKECWHSMGGFSVSDFDRPHVLDLWNNRKADEQIHQRTFFLDQVDVTQLQPKKIQVKKVKGLLPYERQELQVNYAKKTEPDPYFFDKEGFLHEARQYVYPLHFIDFETITPAIPFNKGMYPYEAIAFQFSHHCMAEDGSIKHQTEWINIRQGDFPNFDFLRALKEALSKDEGTIFRYAPHENTILNAIYRQLQGSKEPDKEDLCSWIKTITQSTGNSVEKWEGNRNMVDMCGLVKRFYYHPLMGGSNSIKYVLPAVLQQSGLLREKYSRPVYGKEIQSHNFQNWQWIEEDDKGKVINPYKRLPKLFEDAELAELEKKFLHQDIDDGGAAMTAYAKIQFSQIDEREKEAIIQGLLKYCELDTMAMVMIWEHWMELLGKVDKKVEKGMIV